MKLMVCIDVQVDVPDHLVTAEATPLRIANRAKLSCEERVRLVFRDWPSSVCCTAWTEDSAEGGR